jgi:hypothetical protein
VQPTTDIGEWRELVDSVSGLERDYAVMQAQITTMKYEQDDQKRLLVGDENSPGLKTLMYSMDSNLRLIKWLIGVLIAGLTLYFGIREAEHHSMAQQINDQQVSDAAIPHVRTK